VVRIFRAPHFLLMRRCFIYPVTSKDKTATFGRPTIPMRSRIHHYTIRRLVFGAPNHEIRWSAPYSSMAQSTRNVIVKWFCTLHWTFKWGPNCPLLLPRGRCYFTHSSCFHDATARCVQGICKDNSHILLKLKEATANSMRNISPAELSRALADKMKLVNACL
jgi:hypothetical protein